VTDDFPSTSLGVIHDALTGKWLFTTRERAVQAAIGLGMLAWEGFVVLWPLYLYHTDGFRTGVIGALEIVLVVLVMRTEWG